MAEKTALYLRMAHRNAAEGDICRAVVTIINTLRNNPQFLETQPEAIDFLAEILVPGFEEEIYRLTTRYPSFSAKLYRALASHDKSSLARQLESGFEVYCIERMKTYHACEAALEPVRYAESFPQKTDYQEAVAGSGLWGAVERQNPLPEEQPQTAASQPPPQGFAP